MQTQSEHYYRRAIQDDPQGVNCGRCHNKNDFYDDCGWFYWFSVRWIGTPVCQSCWNELGLSTCER